MLEPHLSFFCFFYGFIKPWVTGNHTNKHVGVGNGEFWAEISTCWLLSFKKIFFFGFHWRESWFFQLKDGLSFSFLRPPANQDLQRYQQVKVQKCTTAGGRPSSLCCTLSPHRASLVQTFLCVSLQTWHHAAQRVPPASVPKHHTRTRQRPRPYSPWPWRLQMLLLSDVHWLDRWAHLERGEGVLTVTFGDTTFTVALVNRRWVTRWL